jgi:hypothetical protein
MPAKAQKSVLDPSQITLSPATEHNGLDCTNSVLPQVLVHPLASVMVT